MAKFTNLNKYRGTIEDLVRHVIDYSYQDEYEHYFDVLGLGDLEGRFGITDEDHTQKVCDLVENGKLIPDNLTIGHIFESIHNLKVVLGIKE